MRFKEFISEQGGYNVPVVPISKDTVDITKPQTRGEINLNLAAELSRQFINPYAPWMAIGKVLSMYGINLPKVILADVEEGEEIVALDQFGGAWGAKPDGTQTPPNERDLPDYYLYFNYGIGEEGFYEAFAVVVDENALNDILETDDVPEEEVEVQ